MARRSRRQVDDGKVEARGRRFCWERVMTMAIGLFGGYQYALLSTLGHLGTADKSASCSCNTGEYRMSFPGEVPRDDIELTPRGSDALPGAKFRPDPVNCTAIKNIPPVNIGQMSSDADVPYYVSFSWWDRRLTRPNFKMKRPLQASKGIRTVHRLLRNTSDRSAFVDVGANVGFMTFFGTSLGRPTYAVDPISYDIAKICEGLAANVAQGWASPESLHLFHAAAGPEYRSNTTIVRNSDEVGYFDQSSLSREVMRGGGHKDEDTKEEVISVITVDSIVPDDVPVGLVKIDVQGCEHGVLMGMSKILSRKEGYPKYVLYENSDAAVAQAGYVPGESARLLERYGYSCELGFDTLCTREDQ